MGHWEDFLNELSVIETKYWRHFKHSKLKDHYILIEDENQALRFGFREDSDLSSEIKNECLELFKKHTSNQRMA